MNCSHISKRFLLLTITIFCIFLLFANYTTKDSQNDVKYRCYMDAVSLNPNTEGSILKDVLDPIPNPGKNIFFLETSCRRTDFQYSAINLTSRQACAIESAALHNPNFQVYLLFASPTYLPKSQPILDALLSYENVKFRQINVWKIAENTPIEKWIKNGTLFESRFMIYHLSDLLRLIVLYRFGGIYMDLDVVVLRSMENLDMNYVGVESYDVIGNSVMSLEPNGFGHIIGEQFLRDYKRNFNGSLWSQNGPLLIGRVLEDICGTSNVTLMIESPQICHGFKVLKSDAFYAINWDYWTFFFNEAVLDFTLGKIKDSYLIHTWSAMSKHEALKVDSNVAYTKLAAQHCPKVFAATVDYF